MDFKYLGARSRTGVRDRGKPEGLRDVGMSKKRFVRLIKGARRLSRAPPNSQSAEREALEILFEAAPPKIPPTCSAVGGGGALIVGAGAAAEYD